MSLHPTLQATLAHVPIEPDVPRFAAGIGHDDPAGAPDTVAYAGVDPMVDARSPQDAFRPAVATRCGGCSWNVDPANWVVALAVLDTLSLAEPIAAQSDTVEVPAICTELIMSRSIFIRHDCGEWASIVIVGNIVIRKPWSRDTSASRPARIRANHEGEAPAMEPTRAEAAPNVKADANAGAHE